MAPLFLLEVEPDVVNYFAYGSNMSFPRIRQRVPHVRRLGVCRLFNHSLRFHKVSQVDGSAKCDAWLTHNPDDCVYGVLFEISDLGKCLMDRYEGLGSGYEEKRVQLVDCYDNSLEAFTYYATLADSSLKPFSWYLAHVIHGAEENFLPARYIDALKAVETTEDPDKRRNARERSIYSS